MAFFPFSDICSKNCEDSNKGQEGEVVGIVKFQVYLKHVNRF